MKIGFAILLDDQCHNFARKLEIELYEKFGLSWGFKRNPHITLKYPFEAEEIELIEKYLENLAGRIKQFDIEFSGFNYFDDRVVYLDVKENFLLKKLHLKIVEGLEKKFNVKLDKFEGDNINFHSTVAADNVTKTKFQEVKSYLKKYRPKLKFRAKELGIFCYLEEYPDFAITIKRIKLKNV